MILAGTRSSNFENDVGQWTRIAFRHFKGGGICYNVLKMADLMERTGVDLSAALAREGYGAGDGAEDRASPGAAWLTPLPLAAVFAAGAGLFWLEVTRLWVFIGLGVAAYGAFAGWMALVAYRLLRRPSTAMALSVWALFLALALFADWFWFFFFEVHDVLLNPFELVSRAWGLIDTRTISVTFNGRRGPPSVFTFGGLPLLAAYVSEIAAVAALAGLVFRAGARGGYFCRNCGTWARARFTLQSIYLLVPESHAFVQLASGDVSPLVSASPVPERRATALQVEVSHCAGCRHGAMWISRVEGTGRGARYRRKAVPVPRLQRIELSPDAVRALLELARRERNAEVFDS